MSRWPWLVLAWLCAAALGAQQPDLVVLHFNDFHGQILPFAAEAEPGRPPAVAGGLGRLAGHIAARHEELGERLWVTNGGDWLQGTPEGLEGKGALVLEALERLPLTASVVGNHEYDWGEAHLAALIAGARHPVLGANIARRGTGELRPYVQPWIVRSVNGLRIALVGLTTSDTPNVSTGPFGDADFRSEEATLRRLWPELRSIADAVVLLTHCGLARDRDLARLFPEVAVILGGHSHTELRRPVVEGRTTIVQSGSRGRALTELGLRVLAGRDPPLAFASFRWIDLDERMPSDVATERFVSERFGALAAVWDTPLGQVEGAIDRRRGAGSTPGGSFVAGLIRAAGQADLGLTNKGGLRTTLRQGPITRRHVFELLPFDNHVVTVAVDGARLWEVLAQGLLPGRQPLEIDGGTYRYRVVDGARELVEVAIAGRPIDRAATYRIATNSFLATGGDGFSALAGAPRVGASPMLLRDLVLDALAESGKIVLQDEPRIGVLPGPGAPGR